MKLSRRQTIILGAVVAASLVVGIALASASSVTIKPAGDSLLVSNNGPLTFAIGSATIVCEPAQTAGTIQSPAASTMDLFALDINGSGEHKCTTTGMGGKTARANTSKQNAYWELTAVSTTSASLVITHLYFTGLGCEVRFASAGSEQITGTWSGAEKEAWFAGPSTLRFAAAPLKAEITTEAGGECPQLRTGGEEVGGNYYNTAKVSGTLLLHDVTHFNEPVTIG